MEPSWRACDEVLETSQQGGLALLRLMMKSALNDHDSPIKWVMLMMKAGKQIMNDVREKTNPENNVIKDTPPSNGASKQNGTIQLRAQVDAMIEHWFTDMWLLVSDEDLKDFSLPMKGKDQKVMAIAYRGQLHLLDSKHAALSTLRSVGILM